MMFLLSGEGPDDMGTCRETPPPCGADRFQPGPMAVIVDRLTEGRAGYSLLESGAVRFVSEEVVAARSKGLTPARSPRLSGQRTKRDTGYFRKNAMALGLMATELETARETPVVAVLFRDADGSNNATRSLWRDKFDSMVKGFRDADHERGVPMVPKPKSEAWLLCALKPVPYQGCIALEDESGSDDSPNSLKRQLAAVVGHRPSATELADWVRDGRIDPSRIDMPSFAAFRTELDRAVQQALAFRR
jgi:hypothetical protein